MITSLLCLAVQRSAGLLIGLVFGAALGAAGLSYLFSRRRWQSWAVAHGTLLRCYGLLESAKRN